MWRALIQAVAALITLIVHIVRRHERRREREEVEAEHAKIDDDPAAWMHEHFGGVRDDAGADAGEGVPDDAAADDDDDDQ